MVLEETQVLEEIITYEQLQKHKNEEKSKNYIYTRKIWDRNEINIDNIFSFTVANEFESQTVNEYRKNV